MDFKSIKKWFIPAMILGAIGAFEMGDSSTGFIGILFALAACAIAVYMYGRKSQCPECKKIYALKQVDKRLVGTKEISVKQSNEIRNNEGKVTGTYDQMVPGERRIYEVDKVCKHCGKKITTRVFEDVANT